MRTKLTTKPEQITNENMLSRAARYDLHLLEELW